MTTVRNKKVAAAVGIAAAAAAVIALGAGTYAAFSATQAGPTATVAAGTLQFGDFANANISVTELSPGESSSLQVLTFRNGGTETGKLTLKLKAITDVEDGCRGDEALFDDGPCVASPTSGDLSGKLRVTISDGGGNTLYDNRPVRDLLSASTSPVTVAAQSNADLRFVFTFPNGDGNDNAAQGDRADITTEARLDQA